jgi:predicted molibdopterin-dependent oxidoreductase YjgC
MWLAADAILFLLTHRFQMSRNYRLQLFTTFHRAELFVNRLTSPVRDRQVHAPEYKVTAVRVERAIEGR